MICTLIFTALYLDPGPQDACLADMRNRSCRPYDDDDRELNLTTATQIAQAVAAALLLSQEAANRTLRVVSLAMTQRGLLDIFIDAVGEHGWTRTSGRVRKLINSLASRLSLSSPGNTLYTHEDVSRLVLLCNFAAQAEGRRFTPRQLVAWFQAGM